MLQETWKEQQKCTFSLEKQLQHTHTHKKQVSFQCKYYAESHFAITNEIISNTRLHQAVCLLLFRHSAHRSLGKDGSYLTIVSDWFGSPHLRVCISFLVLWFPGMVHLQTAVKFFSTRRQQLYIYKGERSYSQYCFAVSLTVREEFHMTLDQACGEHEHGKKLLQSLSTFD